MSIVNQTRAFPRAHISNGSSAFVEGGAFELVDPYSVHFRSRRQIHTISVTFVDANVDAVAALVRPASIDARFIATDRLQAKADKKRREHGHVTPEGSQVAL